MEGGRKPWVFLKTKFAEAAGQFSPDGRRRLPDYADPRLEAAGGMTRFESNKVIRGNFT